VWRASIVEIKVLVWAIASWAALPIPDVTMMKCGGWVVFGACNEGQAASIERSSFGEGVI